MATSGVSSWLQFKPKRSATLQAASFYFKGATGRCRTKSDEIEGTITIENFLQRPGSDSRSPCTSPSVSPQVHSTDLQEEGRSLPAAVANPNVTSEHTKLRMCEQRSSANRGNEITKHRRDDQCAPEDSMFNVPTKMRILQKAIGLAQKSFQSTQYSIPEALLLRAELLSKQGLFRQSRGFLVTNFDQKQVSRRDGGQLKHLNTTPPHSGLSESTYSPESHAWSIQPRLNFTSKMIDATSVVQSQPELITHPIRQNLPIWEKCIQMYIIQNNKKKMNLKSFGCGGKRQLSYCKSKALFIVFNGAEVS
ncbi:hypothetical protein C8F04DRAFT_1198318 [Mycena alexandri]|uniref:Uncharacterized protein n=1 Tax=Mycena alexandri TaxID=1745969 RepID=A0AAD6WN63_9AGAR|nr:hypothetical protein C8F04DRAFT_1198318 [Mycena alexandri]